MINFKVLNDNFFFIENTGVETKQYPRWYEAKITGKDFVRVARYDNQDVLFDNINFADFTVEGLAVTSGIKGAAALNDVIYKNLAAVSTTSPANPKIIQSIPMQSPLGELVWRNLLDDGTQTYTLQNGDVYTGVTAVLQVPELQTANNTKVVVGTAKGLDYTLVAGAYTKAQLETSYGNGLKICYIKALANQDVANSKVAVTTVTDITDTFVDFVEKGSESKSIKGFDEVADFVLTVQGGDATVFLTFFNNI